MKNILTIKASHSNTRCIDDDKKEYEIRTQNSKKKNNVKRSKINYLVSKSGNQNQK